MSRSVVQVAPTLNGQASPLAVVRAAVEQLGWRVIEQPPAAADSLRALVAHWPVPNGVVLIVRELLEHARGNDDWRRALCAWSPPRGLEELPTPRSLGCRLHSVCGVEIAGFVIEVAKRERGGRAWARRRA